MSSNREARRLQDIIENIDSILLYVGTMTFEVYAADQKTIDATERCLQRITEAVIKIGKERMAELTPSIPVHVIRGLGNVLRHGYDEIDLASLYRTFQQDLPLLREASVIALGLIS